MSAKTHTLNYSFAHIGLPLIALGDPKSLLKNLTGPKANEYLGSLWEGLASRLGVDVPAVGPKRLHQVISPTCEAVFIQMPKPQASPEAFFVGIVFWTRKRLLRREISSVRYFTLELGPIPTAPDYHLCEWTGRVPNLDHANFGTLPNASFDQFRDGISKLIGTQR